MATGSWLSIFCRRVYCFFIEKLWLRHIAACSGQRMLDPSPWLYMDQYTVSSKRRSPTIAAWQSYSVWSRVGATGSTLSFIFLDGDCLSLYSSSPNVIQKGSNFQIHTMQLTMVMKKETYTAKKRAIILVDKTNECTIFYFTIFLYSYRSIVVLL